VNDWGRLLDGGEEMDFWTERRVLVTGGAGFLGTHVVRKIQAQGCPGVIVPRSREYDLRDKAAIISLFEQARLDMVIHLAAAVEASAPIANIRDSISTKMPSWDCS
jgi:nucleoside-diphosphate-sugar epimerase